MELEQVNQALRDELSNEVSINKSNEKYINELERKYIRCEKEIQSLNKELEWLENASEEEKAELRLEISSLKKSLHRATKEVREIKSYNANLEQQLQECYEIISSLKQRIKVISSRGNSPVRNNSPDIYLFPEDSDMAHINPFINVFKGLE